MISLITKEKSQLLTYKKTNLKEEVLLTDEKEMIVYFFDYVNKNPQKILLGFNSDLFDLPYLFERAKIHKIKNLLDFNSRRSFNRKSVDLVNSVHFDVYAFYRNIYRQNVKGKSLSLDNLSKEFLGSKKIEVGDMKELYDTNVKLLGEYCLKDSLLTLKLFEKIYSLAIEFSKLTNISLFDVPRVGFSVFVESIYIKEFTKLGELIPTKPSFKEIKQRYGNVHKAAIVLEPVPSLVKGVCQLDFRSLYPSIISAYNISCETRNLIPNLLKSIVLKRDEYKKRKDGGDIVEVYKILANSAYGYFLFSNSRWYGFSQAQKITKIARQSLLNLKNFFENRGFKVLYGDTDSVFIQIKKNLIQKLVDEVNKDLPNPMFLKFEDYYSKGIFVSKKSGSSGAKKKYAFLNSSDKLIIKGFETVRSDWCDFSRKAQKELLNIVLRNDFTEKQIKTFIHEKVRLLEKGKVSTEDLLLKDQIRKNIDDYKSKSPHVLIAKKLISAGFSVKRGSYVEYIVLEGDGKIGERGVPFKLLPENYKLDTQYYLKKQLFPVFDEILNVINVKI